MSKRTKKKGGKAGQPLKIFLREDGEVVRPCCGCKKELSVHEFSPKKRRGGPTGLSSLCKKCCSLKVGLAYHKDPEAARERGRASREKNSEDRNRRARERRLKNPEVARKKAKKYYWKNPEKARATAREAARKNPLRIKASFKKWKDKNPGYWLEHEYGLTLAGRDEMFRNQGGRCAICEKELKLCVDHDHETGKVRGLLCSMCNQGIGIFRDCSKIAYRAAEYLKNHGK